MKTQKKTSGTARLFVVRVSGKAGPHLPAGKICLRLAVKENKSKRGY